MSPAKKTKQNILFTIIKLYYLKKQTKTTICHGFHAFFCNLTCQSRIRLKWGTLGPDFLIQGSTVCYMSDNGCLTDLSTMVVNYPKRYLCLPEISGQSPMAEKPTVKSAIFRWRFTASIKKPSKSSESCSAQ